MDPEYYLWLILIGILHWVLVFMLLQDLAQRQRLQRKTKWPWALMIILLTGVGALLYIICHPGIFIESKDKDEHDADF